MRRGRLAQMDRPDLNLKENDISPKLAHQTKSHSIFTKIFPPLFQNS